MWLTVLLLGLLAARDVPAQIPADRAQEDEAAIRAVVQKYVDARELRDPAAVEALFTEDADQHTTSGEWRRGRAQVVAGTQQSSAQNPGTRTIRVDTVRFVTPDVAIADGPYEIAGAGETRRMWTTFVLRRQTDGWRIAAIRNAAPTGGSRAGAREP
jgi:uncharacterized protein (TIGR02246 family)